MKVTIEKSDLRFSIFKKFVSRSVFGERELTQMLNFQTCCCNLKIRGRWAKLCAAFLLFYFERNYEVLKSCFLLNKNKNFNKNETNRKWKIPKTVLERWIMCVSSYKNCELKVKLSWVGARERKKSGFFVTFDLSEGDFFKICVLSHCVLHWINFQYIYTFVYQKKITNYNFVVYF